jgi:hypothetical protein
LVYDVPALTSRSAGLVSITEQEGETVSRETKAKNLAVATWPILVFAGVVLVVGLVAMVWKASDLSAGSITALVTAVLGVVGTHVGHVAGHQAAMTQTSSYPRSPRSPTRTAEDSGGTDPTVG